MKGRRNKQKKQKCMPKANKIKLARRGKADETNKISRNVCQKLTKASKIKEERQTKQAEQAEMYAGS